MKTLISDYINEYIELCSSLCKKPDDYKKKSNIKKHNKAMKRLIALRDMINKDTTVATKVYAELLNIDDTYIRLTVAAQCITINVHVLDAVMILKCFCKNGEPWERFLAEKILNDRNIDIT